MRKILGCFIFFIIMTASLIFAGNIYYVDGTNGDDSNDGLSLVNAWKTIIKASNTMVAGDTVYIRAGIYSDVDTSSSVIHPDNSGSENNYITYTNYNGEKVICRGPYHGAYLNGVSYIKIDGIEFSNVDQNGTTEVGVRLNNGASHIIVQNCVVKYMEFQHHLNFNKGIYLDTLSSYCQVLNNNVQYVGQWWTGSYSNPGDGIWAQGHHHIVSGNFTDYCGHGGFMVGGDKCIFKNNVGVGSWCRGLAISTSVSEEYRNVVEDNILRDASMTMDSPPRANVGMQNQASNTIFRRNEVRDSVGSGLYIYADSGVATKRIRYYNNTIYNNGTMQQSNWDHGILILDNTPPPGNMEDCDYRNNIFYKNNSDGIHYYIYGDPAYHYFTNNHWNAPGDSSTHGYNITYGDPKFVDEASRDSHLQPDSPCINTGTWLTQTNGGGSGTSIVVEDAGFFTDGFGLQEGDVIQLEGQTETVRIINVDYDNNIITIDSPLTWYFGQGVSLAYNGSAPDKGAYEYQGANPLIANINASPTSGEVPLNVNFTGSATGGTEPYTYSWDFGDSSSSSEQNPIHTYNDPGDYTVTLTVTDSESTQDSDSLIINANAPVTSLVASSSASPTSGEVPLIVNFTGSATGGTEPYTYSWNFGDSTSSSEQSPSHIYSQAGDYTVTFTVTDSQSNQDSDSLNINASVAASPLVASFIASPTSGEAPLTVSFTGSATGGVLPYSYSWDFGDGTSSSEQNPSHTYSDASDYAVYLTVTDSQSNQNSDSLTINASAPTIPLEASCAASPNSGEAPLTVNFTGSAIGGTEPYTYSWDFGDSTSSSEQNPSHVYSEAGDYTVYITVTDSESNQDNDSLTINASSPPTPLGASCTASPISGNAPLTVNFTGSATGGTEPYTYSWDFGDSTSSSEQNPTHSYSDPGDYTVTLTVTDSESNQDSESLTINASTPPAQLEASCAASPESGEVPLTVNFTGNASGGTEPYTYSWDFGDSTSSTEQIPTHTYSDAGDYTVTLTVTDSQSSQNEDSLIINASAPAIPLVASCTASPVSGEAPLTVNFTGIATGGVLPYSYSWDFGDGTSSSEQNPSHIYSQAGDYTAYLTVTDSDSNQDNDSVIINASAATNSAYLSCSPKSLLFGATTSGNVTTDQYLRIINAGSGELTWNIEHDADWLSCSPSSGIDKGKITVSVDASGLSLGLYIATITVSSPEAYNSPQYVSVNFRVYEPEQENPPFGSLDTPDDGSTVSGSIPITGWALDDIEVTRLEIKRNSDPLDPLEAIGLDGLVYIGDAVFVEGARPDVEKSYADYPLSSRAGWGYMLLTNDLPYRGNGSFTIYTFAHDAGGHREEIGRKTILCDNINRVKPFGTIDTPEQGEIIRGSDYVNFGWALTPLPKTIPKDGNTIWVWVDGVQVGHPVYDQYREDIATLYPEYNNAHGAVGYYYLDTTQYENGMHTIAWSVMDDEGEVDEIGSRYFFIDNIETASVHNGSFGLKSIYQEDAEGRLRIGIREVRREHRLQVDDDKEIATKSILKIQIEEMEPVRIVLEESSGRNMEYIGWGENGSKDLPIGSTLDREKGIFSWIPTPGFIGRYVLHFAVTDGSYMSEPLRVEVNVIPKRDRNKENL